MHFSHFNYNQSGVRSVSASIDIIDETGTYHRKIWENTDRVGTINFGKANWLRDTIDLSTYQQYGDFMILQFKTVVNPTYSYSSSSFYLDNIVIEGKREKMIVDTTTWQGTTSTDWGTSSNWSDGLPNCETSAKISVNSNGNYPYINTTVDVKNINIEVNAGIKVDTLGVLNVCGNWHNDGEGKIGAGVVNMQSYDPTSLSGNTEFGTLIINSQTGVEIQPDANIKIKDWISILSGTLFTNNKLRLLSHLDTTASLTEIGRNADIVGDVTVDRYIQSGETGWRFLSSPVQHRTIADWNDDFFTSGFAGSNYPGYYFTSIYYFDEKAKVIIPIRIVLCCTGDDKKPNLFPPIECYLSTHLLQYLHFCRFLMMLWYLNEIII